MNYSEHVAGIHQALGIPADYATARRLSLIPEATHRVNVEMDSSGRPRSLAPRTAHAWGEMKAAAAQAGCVLELVSAYRSVDYQRGLVERKRARGLTWDEIFRVSAAPGYSEHHSGQAVDLNCPGCPPLEAAFADTREFAWLLAQAPNHGWRLSFPPDNPHGITFEPWHWFFEREA